jgi:heme exporter protein C
MQKQSVKLTILDAASVVLLTAALVIVFFLTPLEETMGAVQKVFYMHVSAAWVGMLGFLAAAVCGGLYLTKRETRWDVMSETGVEIGLVFTLVGIVSGSIWAKPVWNTWWTWDPRLTTSAVMVLIYLAYQMLRSGLDNPGRRARYSAVYAVAGFVTVPLTFFSIRMFRTIHPVVVGGSSGMFAMDQSMLTAFFVCLTAFTVLFVDLFWNRYLLGRQSEELEELEAGRFGESL